MQQPVVSASTTGAVSPAATGLQTSGAEPKHRASVSGRQPSQSLEATAAPGGPAQASHMQAYAPLMAEFLIEASEVESRLRQHVMELVEPTIKKQNVVEKRFTEVKAIMASNRADIDDLMSTRDSADSIHSTLESFRVELASWDKQRHEHEMKVSNRLSVQEVEINGLRQSLEMLKGLDHSSVHRTLQNMGDMLTQYKDESTDLRRFCTERIDLSRDKTLKLRDEFETRTLAMENKMHVLQDMQTQTNTSITHIDELVTIMDDRVKKAGEGIADLWRAKVSVVCLEEQQQDLSEFMQHVNGIVSSLKQQFGSLIDDVKGHFQTATQLVGRSTAEQMNSMRVKYEDDRTRVDSLHNQIQDFVIKQKISLDRMEGEVNATKETANNAMKDLGNGLDKLRQARDVDQKMAQIEMGHIRHLVKELAEAGPVTSGAEPVANRAPSHKHDLLLTLLESACIELACEMQDEKDRKSIHLFGTKPAIPDKDSLSHSLSSPLSPRLTAHGRDPLSLPDITGSGKRASLASVSGPLSSSPRKRASAINNLLEQGFHHTADSGLGRIDSGLSSIADQVVSIDNRCLSCSSNAMTVLAGFKMACLRYEPGLVEYEGNTYSRSDLICKRRELLQQAKTVLKQHAAPARPIE